ncbi:AAA family ATPase [Legionella sp. 29fVS95]|uniref:AAA family ATPase n=1 Tax=Legionella sp. 29fVS95 TaxID=3402813 RepID=UPI003AF7D7E6
MSSKIIAISGTSGVGKTTLTKALANALDATCLFWDDFDELASGPDDYLAWYERGQNYAEWNYTALAEVLAKLGANQVVEHPALKKQLQATDYIILDAPLGRLHQQTANYITTFVHIVTPLDVSLVRRLLRDFKDVNTSKEDLLNELESYLTRTRKLFFDGELKKTADLLIDGLLSTEAQVDLIQSYLRNGKDKQPG